ncbi:all trans-polyprenyl-diphosphate synthase PDSS2-like [Uranotaenia lowii]|uniref:all trans-polyprenyl-diphosphate synthase PDSS2-like n=1 Tax=Uranotaenia lowii TaxID=190385 RepID=UPI0024796D12|nr:all trans-polyprenyl-diphosphate synthase PDSS2-like [Uranotaenia lowii]
MNFLKLVSKYDINQSISHMSLRRVTKNKCALRSLFWFKESRSNSTTSSTLNHACWNQAISRAEQICGYQRSMFQVDGIPSTIDTKDTLTLPTNILKLLSKLEGSGHPLVRTISDKLIKHTVIQDWELLVFLVSKSFGQSSSIKNSSNVLESQRIIAKVAVKMFFQYHLHQAVVNLQPLNNAGNDLEADNALVVGNKVAILAGDLMLAQAFQNLSDLKNPEIQELIALACRDMTESHFIGRRDEANNPLPLNPVKKNSTKKDFYSDLAGNPEKEWTLHHTLATGSLLGKCFQGALILAEHPKMIQNQGNLLGWHLALAWKAADDIASILNFTKSEDSKFDLIAAPFLFHLQHEPNLYKEIEEGQAIDYVKLHKQVSKGPGLKQTRQLQKKHRLAALAIVAELQPSDAREVLQDLVMATQNLSKVSE